MDSVEIQLKRILDEYNTKVQEVSREACKKVSKNLSRTLKGSSPRRSGEYAAGWAAKMLDSDTYVVYNKAKPGLTHLLENGHVIKNKYGTYGRAPAYKHIKPAADNAQEELITEIEARL